MNKIEYIIANGSACKECGSSEITRSDMRILISSPTTCLVTCNACKAEWRDVLIVGDVVSVDGSPINPGVLPLNEIFQWRWIVYVPILSEPQIGGPFKDRDVLMSAAEKIRLDFHGDIFEAGLDLSTGKIFFTEMDFGPRVGDSCPYTVGCGGVLGKNDEGVICPQCGLGESAEGD